MEVNFELSDSSIFNVLFLCGIYNYERFSWRLQLIKIKKYIKTFLGGVL